MLKRPIGSYVSIPEEDGIYCVLFGVVHKDGTVKVLIRDILSKEERLVDQESVVHYLEIPRCPDLDHIRLVEKVVWR